MLGHFGLNADDLEACLPFYLDFLGLAVFDTINFNRNFNLDGKKGGRESATFSGTAPSIIPLCSFPCGRRAIPDRPDLPPLAAINHATGQIPGQFPMGW